MAKIYYQEDCNLSLLEGQKIARITIIEFFGGCSYGLV